MHFPLMGVLGVLGCIVCMVCLVWGAQNGTVALHMRRAWCAWSWAPQPIAAPDEFGAIDNSHL